METKPGDLVGPDSHGKWRVSREIPLPWLVAMAGGLFLQAATVWFSQQQMAEDVRELKTTIHEIRQQSQAIAGKDIEHSLRLIELERRVANVEQQSAKK